ncbi:hydroxyisourate hydrolase [Paenibacillus sp. IB182496]|uniref:Hydroxyisourate hydrolase n=1 Tax=Paenibacillus sabuli TaxID=2772509 RepID=A0A927GV95_9BACL|nr:hydroxyisourate hydrolase [Paenibacillus sabuli]MBD2848522.1 hydroxyisourate hydrolase [Paenibacillus sabuli]
MNGQLTTHVLDLMRGEPAAGMRLQLWRDRPDGVRALLLTTSAGPDGRPDRPLLEGGAMTAGVYELVFFVEAYFRERARAESGARGEAPADASAAQQEAATASAEPAAAQDRVQPEPGGEPDGPFLETVPIRFRIGAVHAHYHVPLLVAPGGYSTYRGS